ncbi:MAG: AAA family ATPase [Clostridiales bacterium]|nr:AAA family ATPase [Clostridiales bacterium]
MGTGIIVCGLNGSGKSTLGKALAEKLNFHFIDNENLFFPKVNLNYIYAASRSREEAEKILINEVKLHENFVFAAVKGDYGEEIFPFYKYAVCIDVPKEIRLQRIRNRSFQKFGNRMLPGGDLYEQEKAFFDMASSRSEQYVEEWIQTLHCPTIRVDGTKPIEENLTLIMEQIHNNQFDVRSGKLFST